jgi:hypothetical protein
VKENYARLAGQKSCTIPNAGQKPGGKAEALTLQRLADFNPMVQNL